MATKDDIIARAARFAPLTAAAFPRMWTPHPDNAHALLDEQGRTEALANPAYEGEPEGPWKWAAFGLAPGSGEHGDAKDEEEAKALAGAAVARLRAAGVGS